MEQWIIICLLIACANIAHQVSTPNSETYTAAVVEFPPVHEIDAESTLKANTDSYIRNIKIANASDVDIIVFPEDGLTTISLPGREKMDDWSTIIPAAFKNYIPCDENTIKVSETLRRISCAAKENRIYVVINIAEKLPCDNSTCTKYDEAYYNTNVVFDRNGKIIARYRKTNLFVEPQFNITRIPEIVTFDTDFGVTFGTFICFDILFKIPALLLTRIHQITDIVYPTAWFSEMPFLTAVQTQAGWSFAEDVNLLVAGYNNPPRGSTGSGIYLGRKGIGKAIMSPTLHEEVLIYKVPKMKKKTESNQQASHSTDGQGNFFHGKKHVHDELRKKREDNTVASDRLKLLRDKIDSFDTLPLEGNSTRTICQNDFCCDFTVEMLKIDPTTKYRLAVFNGVRSFYAINGSVSACGIMQCSNQSIESCGSTEESETVFGNIDISTTFHNYKNVLIMPSILDSQLYPFKVTDWSYGEHTHEDHVHVSISLINKKNNLLTFGLYSRNFVNGASVPSFNIVTYFAALLLALFLPNFIRYVY
ncbi:PREDICTED: vanin-like protein 1 isoform X2 [Dinoponera quadriceps]|nr:PREDICTED: vanin-like protein 1 isoform X2 [Dinoponera quadriceps]XP_014489019.1 PREDICTED: vanin-like protein 1 isoform X2 [Dinoponera quadriceps]XP_014489020.1 PREDICTED: vanin-like protein 1 isoform X2 [Dinoponera quadriceps]